MNYSEAFRYLKEHKPNLEESIALYNNVIDSHKSTFVRSVLYYDKPINNIFIKYINYEIECSPSLIKLVCINQNNKLMFMHLVSLGHMSIHELYKVIIDIDHLGAFKYLQDKFGYDRDKYYFYIKNNFIEYKLNIVKYLMPFSYEEALDLLTIDLCTGHSNDGNKIKYSDLSVTSGLINIILENQKEQNLNFRYIANILGINYNGYKLLGPLFIKGIIPDYLYTSLIITGDPILLLELLYSSDYTIPCVSNDGQYMNKMISNILDELYLISNAETDNLLFGLIEYMLVNNISINQPVINKKRKFYNLGYVASIGMILNLVCNLTNNATKNNRIIKKVKKPKINYSMLDMNFRVSTYFRRFPHNTQVVVWKKYFTSMINFTFIIT